MAIEATYDGSGTIHVIFDCPYLESQHGVAGTNPTAMVQTDIIDSNPVGKSLLINETDFTIVAFEKLDDGAITLLQLRET